MRLPLYQVDAFTDRVFGGNPAAVCPLDSWIDDAVMQAIALENNLSETAFFVRRGEVYELRWFTPAVEVDLCGHATLGSAWVIFNRIDPDRREIRFHTRSGVLTVRRDGETLTMDLPANPPRLVEAVPGLAEALGKAPQQVLATGGHYLAVYDRAAAVRDLAPHAAALIALDRLGIIVTAPGEDAVDFVSRYFAPRKGVMEDPVTGAAHCVLTPYWAERLGKEALTARQISRRGGALGCRLRSDRVELSGRVAPYMQGTIEI